jgi:hypothetical protein
METKDIIQQGERAKYIVKSMRRDFDFEFNNFTLEIRFGLMSKKITIPKSQFQHLTGRWVFSFSTDHIVGPVVAKLIMEIPDPDCPGNIRQEIDEQVIAFIITHPNPQFFKCPHIESAQQIIYTRTEISNIDELYVRLCDNSGIPLKTSDNEYMYALKKRQ